MSQIVFEFIIDYQSDEERQSRIYEAKENIYALCMNSYEDEELPQDEKYCSCYGSSYIDNSGNANAVKKECGKLPKFLPSK